jgi:hypothetical protein
MKAKKQKKWVIWVSILAVLFVLGMIKESTTDYSDACTCASVLSASKAYNTTADNRYWACKNKYTNWGGANKGCVKYNKRNK